MEYSAVSDPARGPQSIALHHPHIQWRAAGKDGRRNHCAVIGTESGDWPHVWNEAALALASSVTTENVSMSEPTKSTRTEKDSLGHKEIPGQAYYGVQT